MYHLDSPNRPAFITDPDLRSRCAGRRVLVLGGDGFLGSSVATALHVLGADVAVLSRRRVPLLDRSGVQLFRGHLMQREVLAQALTGRDVVFDLAGTSGAVDSNRDPRRNLTEECEPHLNAFQMSAELPRPPLVVFCSSRTVYGKAPQLPVSEWHRLAPESIYAIHKLTLEHYLQHLAASRRLGYLIFRLSNPYGPQLEPENKTYGILNQFILRALRGEPIRLFGDGAQQRDYVFIDDVVETFVRAAVHPACANEVFNLGGPAPLSMREAVDILLQECPGSTVSHEPWPRDYAAVETGDYATDCTKLREKLGYAPGVGFREGIRRTIATQRAWAHRPVRVTVTDPPSSAGAPSTPPAADPTRHWPGRRVLVTGASGFLGQVLVRRLLGLGAAVAALHRRPLAADLADHGSLVSLPLGLEQTEDLERGLAGFKPDVVFHLASRPDGPEVANHAVAGAQTNVVATVGLLELARLHGVSAFVFAGSAKIYGGTPVPHREDSSTDPQSSYAASKLAAWSYARVFARIHDLPIVALHPTLVYGPAPGANLFTFLAHCLRSGKPEIELEGGQQTRDPIYLDDAIEAYLRAAERAPGLKSRAIPIGGGREYPVREIAERFVHAAGYHTPVRPNEQRLRRTEMMRSYCDNLEARDALGWEPRVSLDEGLRRTAEFLLGKPPA